MSRRLMVLAVFGCMAALMLALSGVAQAQTIGVGDTFSLPFGATAGPTESIVVTQTASSGVRFNSATASQGTCNVLPSVLTCDLGTVLAGQQVTGTINFTFTQAGEQTITFGLCGSLTGCFTNPPRTSAAPSSRVYCPRRNRRHLGSQCPQRHARQGRDLWSGWQRPHRR